MLLWARDGLPVFAACTNSDCQWEAQVIGHRQVDVGIIHQGNLARLRSYVHKLREGVRTKMGELTLSGHTRTSPLTILKPYGTHGQCTFSVWRCSSVSSSGFLIQWIGCVCVCMCLEVYII